jgi:hypothetical protein
MTAKCRSVYPISQSKEAVEAVAHNRPKPRKIKPETLFPIVLALAAIILAPGAKAQHSRQEGPIEIEKCQTISQPGSYKLVNNITFVATQTNFICLQITAASVTIDLAGFTISQSTSAGGGTGIAAKPPSGGDALFGIAVRNGSLSDFTNAVDLSSAEGSIVEGLRIPFFLAVGISANGIVKGNTVNGGFGPGMGIGIDATGIIAGNYVHARTLGISAGQGSTVVGNTVTEIPRDGFAGISVNCPSNVTDNTAVNNTGIGGNLVLNGTGCNNTNNVAP